MSNEKIGAQTRFLQATAPDSGVFTLVAGVKSIGGPSRSRDAVDATDLQPTDDYEKMIPGLKKGGEVSLVINHRPDHLSQGTTAGLNKAFEDGLETDWRIEWPQFANVPSMTFRGFLTAYEVTTATKDIITAAIKIQVQGKPTLANFA